MHTNSIFQKRTYHPLCGTQDIQLFLDTRDTTDSTTLQILAAASVKRESSWLFWPCRGLISRHMVHTKLQAAGEVHAHVRYAIPKQDVYKPDTRVAVLPPSVTGIKWVSTPVYMYMNIIACCQWRLQKNWLLAILHLREEPAPSAEPCDKWKIWLKNITQSWLCMSPHIFYTYFHKHKSKFYMGACKWRLSQISSDTPREWWPTIFAGEWYVEYLASIAAHKEAVLWLSRQVLSQCTACFCSCCRIIICVPENNFHIASIFLEGSPCLQHLHNANLKI